MKIIDANAENIAAFYGSTVRRTCRSWAIVDGDKVLCIFGYLREGIGLVIFSDALPELRSHALVIMRAAKILFAELRAKHLPVFAKSDQSIPASDSFLCHLGFERQSNGVFKWQA